ncbi:hypothetical protein SMALB_5388, partial [Streptomyces malaysiensis]|nr:hypothetical protein [Streptomyces malaysiensis]
MGAPTTPVRPRPAPEAPGPGAPCPGRSCAAPGAATACAAVRLRPARRFAVGRSQPVAVAHHPRHQPVAAVRVVPLRCLCGPGEFAERGGVGVCWQDPRTRVRGEGDDSGGGVAFPHPAPSRTRGLRPLTPPGLRPGPRSSNAGGAGVGPPELQEPLDSERGGAGGSGKGRGGGIREGAGLWIRG